MEDERYIAWFVLLLAVALSGARVHGAQPAPALYRWGHPEGTVIDEGAWCFAFNGSTRTARWVLEHPTRETLAGDAERQDKFFADPRIPIEFRPTLADYAGTGYDRGHLACAGNYGSAAAKAATFSLANMTPQDPTLNRGLWRQLELHVRDLAADGTHMWVLTCPLWLPSRGGVHYRLIGENSVGVPTHYAKAVLIDAAGGIRLQAWRAPNRPPADSTTLDDWRTSVDEVERSAGLNLWAELPDPLESRLEAQK